MSYPAFSLLYSLFRPCELRQLLDQELEEGGRGEGVGWNRRDYTSIERTRRISEQGVKQREGARESSTEAQLKTRNLFI